MSLDLQLGADTPATQVSETFTRMLLRFLKTLHDCGRAQIGQPDQYLVGALQNAGKDQRETRQILRLLEGWHSEAVLDLPGPGIDFHTDAAMWGGILLFRAACITSFREIEGSEIAGLLQGDPMPDSTKPGAHFSADLCLRHWPALYRMARSLSEDDVLIKTMHGLAEQFPLSSLGMNLGVSPDSPVLRHAGLRQFFAERALERSDHACLAIPEIGAFVRSKLGAYSATLGRGLLSTSPAS